MKIEMFKRNIKLAKINPEAATSELRELKIGTYNEFYLPSVDYDSELWIIVTDDNNEMTRIHLKR